ncbi:MAG: signal recognition particle-docking protein FtsY [Candidatus Woesearchaeota archaeon]
MFGFLKDKLKKAVSKFSKEVESSSQEKEEIIDKNAENIQKPENQKGFFKKIFGKKDSHENIDLKEDKKEKDTKIAQDIKISDNIKSEFEEIKPEKKTEIFQKKEKEETKILEAPHIEKDIKEKKELEIEKKQEHKEELSKTPTNKVEKGNIDEKRTEIRSLKKELPKDSSEKNFFSKITDTFTKVQLTEEKFEELFWDLELVLLENNVAVEVIEKIKNDMKKELLSEKISRKSVNELILTSLKNSIIDLFDIDTIDLIKSIKEKKKKPYIITIIGVNGSGKTTSIAKLTNLFQKNGLKVVLAASDTFRAAAIQQLEEHASKLNVKLIKHDYNSDPAAVAFDAIKYAEAKDIDVVIIDTAGRLHSNTNLMRELEKVVRVCKPDIKIFVGESITGNDCIEQAKEFDKVVGIDAIILAKADVDEKGGAAISVSYVTKKPILYLGTGQSYDDLKEFDPKIIIESLEL